MYLMRNRLGMSYSEIAEVFSRDHTTVMHACKVAAVTMPEEIAKLAAALDERRALSAP